MCAVISRFSSDGLFCNSMDHSLTDSSVHGDSPGNNTGVGCHFLLQGILLTQGLNPCLLCFLYREVGSLLLGSPFWQNINILRKQRCKKGQATQFYEPTVIFHCLSSCPRWRRGFTDIFSPSGRVGFKGCQIGFNKNS